MAAPRKGFLIAGALALGLAFLFRKSVASTGRMAVDLAKKQFFLAAIPARSHIYADHILRVAQEEGVSPFLLVAIMERESRSGQALSPPGPGGTGDFGHGRGLMQVDDRSWTQWLATNNWKDPYTNIKKGAQIYKGKRAYILSKVPNLSELQLVKASLAAYNRGEGATVKSLQAGKDPDQGTAGNDYGIAVYTNLAAMEAKFKALGG